MKYKDILENKRMDEIQYNKFIELLDEYAPDSENLKLYLSMLINNGHYNEFTAIHCIKQMQAVAYLDRDNNVIYAENMLDYLNKIGLSPEYSHSLVMDAYNKARTKASEKGFSAPPLDVNMWDTYQSIAMILSDYWYSVEGNLEKAAMLAYEYLSDPDKKR